LNGDIGFSVPIRCGYDPIIGAKSATRASLGLSQAEDRVWAQIAGMEPWERLFVVLQAYIDDSYTANSSFVLAGYVASAAAWAAFSKDWEALFPLLPPSARGASGKPRFKMSEMRHYPDRIPPFYKAIEDHVLLRLSCKVNISDVDQAKRRIWSDNIRIHWGPPSDPFWIAFGTLVTQFYRLHYEHKGIADTLPPGEKVDFYFDEHSGGAAQVMLDWEEYFVKKAPQEVRDLYGAMPRFESDEVFMPLQAADFWAWWVREGYETGALHQYMEGDFVGWRATKKIPTINIEITQDGIVENLIYKIKSISGLDGMIANIYDETVKPRNRDSEIPSLTRAPRSTLRSRAQQILRGFRIPFGRPFG
jgi:hypothetical protein